jgi:hypothetical protein
LFRKRLHYYVIIFKHEKDFLRTFDLGILHKKIYTKFIDKNRREGLSEAEKELRAISYTNAIEEFFNFEEEEIKTADGYYKTGLVMRKRKTAEGMTKKDKDRKRGRGGGKDYGNKKIKGIEDVIGGKN